jgi:hypothetical protein
MFNQDLIRSRFHSIISKEDSSDKQAISSNKAINNIHLNTTEELGYVEAKIIHAKEEHDPRPLFQRLQSLKEKEEEEKEEYYKQLNRIRLEEDTEFIYLQMDADKKKQLDIQRQDEALVQEFRKDVDSNKASSAKTQLFPGSIESDARKKRQSPVDKQRLLIGKGIKLKKPKVENDEHTAIVSNQEKRAVTSLVSYNSDASSD